MGNIETLLSLYNNQGVENWKSLSLLKFSNYAVSDLGNVRNITTGRLLKLTPRTNGYIAITMTSDNDKPRTVLVHKLVASAFIRIGKKGETVDHINRNRGENRASNLRWATAVEQLKNQKLHKIKNGRTVFQYDITGQTLLNTFKSLKDASVYMKHNCRGKIRKACRNNKPCEGYMWKYREVIMVLPGEEWRQIDDIYTIPVYVSNLGRIKKYNRITRGTIVASYRKIILKTKEGRKKGVFVHRLVAEAFLGKSALMVNHKDGNKNNNCLDNLEYVTASQNLIHAYETGLRKSKTRSVIQMDNLGNVITKFKSVKEAAAATQIYFGSIYNVCSNHATLAGNFRWKYD